MTLQKWSEIILAKEVWQQAYSRLEQKEFQDKEQQLKQFKELIDTDAYLQVADQLTTGTYDWSIPEKVAIAKVGTTKKRIVYMYTPYERLLQGVLYRALAIYHADNISDLCFSYKKGVSTINAVKYIQRLKGTTQMYGLKMDISSYFNSVAYDHLVETLNDATEELQGVRKTLEKLYLDNRVNYRGKQIEEYKALIAGSSLGSFFANYCLRDVDSHFEMLQQQYLAKGEILVYARYSDDILIMHEDEQEVLKLTEVLKGFIAKYGLTINPSKYEHFAHEDAIDYLGLELSPKGIDIASNSLRKVKVTIKRWVKKARKRIEMGQSTFSREARSIVNRLNMKYFTSYIIDEKRYGWGYYAFRFITVTDSLTFLDFYLKDQLRYLKTGKHNKHNWAAITEEEFYNLGVVSLYDMYQLFRDDFRAYYVRASLIKRGR